MSTEVMKFTNADISAKISNDENYKSILKAYNNKEGLTGGFGVTFTNQYNNGLAEMLVGITLNGKLVQLIVPIFSTEKTITWNNMYLKTIKSVLPEEYQGLEDHEYIEMIKCPLFYLDKWSGDLLFMSLVNLSDWMANGNKGKNGYSVYYWNDKLPNKDSISKKELNNEVFNMILPLLSTDKIKVICNEYANRWFKKFNSGLEKKRTDAAKIKNIADGLYAELSVFLYMKQGGYDVSINWTNSDDLGIDIIFKIAGVEINIDVKSTRDEYLKISKNRQETDFYAITTWGPEDSVLLVGFIHKYAFWKSEIAKNFDGPEKDGDMYKKSLESLEEKYVSTEDMFKIFNDFKKKKMKRGNTLFNRE